MRSQAIPASLFVLNRSRLASLLSPDSVLFIKSGRKQSRNGGQFYPFRQQSDFFYLTGIKQEKCSLLCCPGHPDPALREILFINRPTRKSDLWSGPSIGQEEASALSGIGNVRWLDEQDEYLRLLSLNVRVMYTDHENDLSHHLRKAFLSPLLQSLRVIKQAEEIEEIRKAVSITRSAFLRVLKHLKPGMMEYQVEAEIIGEFIGRGAEGHAFEPIMASGKNALILHYLNNDCLCKDGEMLLMDFGAELNHYAADCSRTIPVNGRFSPRQRELYDAAYRIFQKARDLMLSGTLMADFHKAVGELWEEEHIGLGLYTRKAAEAHRDSDPLWKKYFMHGTSHSMGLDVHDPFDCSLPFEPGMVLTCEPAIYIPEEGIGIRLENDILITREGPVDLMQDIPMEADEIESLMNSSK